MNLISLHRTVGVANTREFPLRVIVDLPGPYLTGFQFDSDENIAAAISEIDIRFLCNNSLIMPDPSANVLTPLTEVPDDMWYNCVLLEWNYVRLVAPEPHRMVIELASGGQGDILVNLNLQVSAKPPEQTMLNLLAELNQGIQRIPHASEAIGDAVKRLEVLLQTRGAQ